MGCFSFMCKECGTSIRSDSVSGEMVRLFLLKDGKVIQEMEGEYDSYGTVFKPKTSIVSKVLNKGRDSFKWDCPEIREAIKGKERKIKVIGLEHTMWHAVTDLISKGEGYRNPGYGLPLVDDVDYEVWSKIYTTCDLEDALETLNSRRNKIDDREWLKEPEPGNGIAAIHSACYTGTPPTTLSPHDPNQGWDEMREEYML